jgi:hypothetical protein
LLPEKPSARWPSVKARQALAALLRIGWRVKRQSGTSHPGAPRLARRPVRLPRPSDPGAGSHLGKQAACVNEQGDLRVYAKELEDGSKAVGLFNLGEKEAAVTARWSDLKLSGAQMVRDLWRQKDLGQFDGQFEAKVASHGVVLVRMRTAGG